MNQEENKPLGSDKKYSHRIFFSLDLPDNSKQVGRIGFLFLFFPYFTEEEINNQEVNCPRS